MLPAYMLAAAFLHNDDNFSSLLLQIPNKIVSEYGKA